MNKIGFACKFSENHKGIITSIPEYNTKTTTVAWLNRQSKSIQEKKLFDLMCHNIKSIVNLVNKISTLEKPLRFVRLSSEILPLYTHKDFKWFWQSHYVQSYAEKHFNKIGIIAKNNNVRLSFHPGQFCCLASDKPEVLKNSIDEFEYHVTMAKWMGYGFSFHNDGFKINIHISGKKGPQGMIESYHKLSPEARNLITIENEEMTWGIDDCLSISNIIPVVLDVHHHWVKTGEYISRNDDRIQKIIDSWQGIIPVIHYSNCSEKYFSNVNTEMPNYSKLLNSGINKKDLRAHSVYFTNKIINDWCKTHWEWADVMCESKSKNLSSFDLYKEWC